MGFDLLDMVASAFNLPPLPRPYALTRIRVGSAVVTWRGVPIGRLRRARGGVDVGRWSFVAIDGTREGRFRTRSAAAQALRWWWETLLAGPPDAIDDRLATRISL